MKVASLLLALAAVPAFPGRAVAEFAEAAFSFEGILTQTEGASDGDGGSGNGAVHRGVVSLTVTKRGSFSGKIRYNELLADQNTQATVYKPVVRSFSGVLKPTDGTEGMYTWTAALGVGTAAGRQRMVLKADYSGAQPTATAEIIDVVSTNSSGGKGFSSQTPPLTGLECGSTPAGPSGRFVLTNASAYILAQTLPTGKLLWSTRMPNYSNSGSALTADSTSGVTAALYESKTFKTAAGSEVNSLLGMIELVRPLTTTSAWGVRVGDPYFAGGLDWQSSLSPSQSAQPANSGEEAGAAAPTGTAAFYCEQVLLGFSSENARQWGSLESGSVGQSGQNMAGILPSSPVLLTLQDYSGAGVSGSPAVYSWQVYFSAKGVRIEGLARDGVLPPVLSLRLVRDRGEITGSIGMAGTRRRLLKGAALGNDGSGFSARGWIEPDGLNDLNLSLWEISPGGGMQMGAASAAAAPASTAPVSSAVSSAATCSTAAASAASAASAAATTDTDCCLPPLIDPPPLIAPPPLILPPALIDPPPLIAPPPLIDPPPLIAPPPLIDPPPLIAPPPLIDPPPLIAPPPLIDPPPLIQPPGLIAPPPLIDPPPLCVC